MVKLLIGLDSVALAREARRAADPEPATAAAPEPVEESTVAASRAEPEAANASQCRPPWC